MTLVVALIVGCAIGALGCRACFQVRGLANSKSHVRASRWYHYINVESRHTRPVYPENRRVYVARFRTLASLRSRGGWR